MLEGARKLLALDGFVRKRRLRFSYETKAGLIRTCNVWQCCAVGDAVAGQWLSGLGFGRELGLWWHED